MAAPAGATTFTDDDFDERVAVSGLAGPVAMAWAPDGRMFVAEKFGEVRVVEPGQDTSEFLLNIQDRVNQYGDRGLVGIAVDKDFTSNGGFIYLGYVAETQPLMPDEDGAMVSRVTRITVGPDGTVADPGEPLETVILGKRDPLSGACPAPANNAVDCMPADSVSHTVGTVRVDPTDGTLWVGNGDGAGFSGVDPTALRTLDERSLSGKILHVDSLGRGLPGHARCPAETDLTRNCTKVHAMGFRNPFRFSLRPEGGVAVGDVGWTTKEEIDLAPVAGKSFGWPCYEGTERTASYQDLQACQDLYADVNAPQEPPVYEYDRAGTDGAIIGGPTYVSGSYPASFNGSMFFGDYAKQELKRISFPAAGPPVVSPMATDWFGTDLAIGPDGNLYTTDLISGTVKKVVYTPQNRYPTARATATPPGGNSPLQVQFTGSNSTDPESAALTYDWDFDDGSAHSTSANPVHTYTQDGVYQATLTVSDPEGLTDTASVTITPDNDPPTATITAPIDAALYRDGDEVQLRGSATDPDETLPPTSLRWDVRLLHGEHMHPLTTVYGTQPSFTAATHHDADSSYEITLTATDSQDATSVQTVNVHPEVVQARIESAPAGAPVSYGGRNGAAPYTQVTAVGYETTVTAQQTFAKDGRSYTFVGWEDGGDQRVRAWTVPDSDFVLTARYAEDPSGPGPDPEPAPDSKEPAPPPTNSSRYAGVVRAARGLAAFFGLGDRSFKARDLEGGRAGRYLGDPPRAAALLAGTTDAGRAFDGYNDAVQLAPASLRGAKAFAAEAWVHPEPARVKGARRYIVSSARTASREGFDLYLDGRGRLRLAVAGKPRKAVAVGPRLRSNTTYHVVGAYDSERISLYVNGARRVALGYKAALRLGGTLRLGHPAVGRRGRGGAFSGRLDEVALYRRALTATEVRAHWAARLP